jgi:hypothetical protein
VIRRGEQDAVLVSAVLDGRRDLQSVLPVPLVRA